MDKHGHLKVTTRIWMYLIIFLVLLKIVLCHSLVLKSHYGYGHPVYKPAIPCAVSLWTEWGQIDYFGQQRRYRWIVETAENGGEPCPDLTDIRTGKT